MELNQERINQLAVRLDENEVTDRHRMELRTRFETIFDITMENADSRFDTVARLLIQERSNQLSVEQYKQLLKELPDLDELLSMASHSEAFERLLRIDYIGQKIANEILHHAVDIFRLQEDDEWLYDLDVALDIHVVQALIKTGSIEMSKTEADKRSAGRIINMDPNADPHTLIAYSDVQDAFRDAASAIDEPPIVFDELWTEHREFIANPLLQTESVFYDVEEPANSLILEGYRVAG